MAAVVLSVVAALATLVVVILVLRPARPATAEEDRAAAATLDLRERMDSMRRELTEAQHEARRQRALGELAGTLDLDDLTAQVAASAARVAGADAALVEAVGAAGRRATASVGLRADETDALPAALAPEGPHARSTTLAFREAGAAPGAIRSALVVELAGRHGAVGRLAVFFRGSRTPGDAEERQLTALAPTLGRALEGARLVEEARTRGDLDAATGLPHRRRFAELLENEVARARRCGEPLSLTLFDLDDFGAVNRRHGHDAGDAVLREAAERTAALVSLDDPLARIGPDEFAVVLRDADLARAEAFLGALRRELVANPVPALGRLTISAAAAQLDPGEDAATFFQRADATLARARAGGGLVLAAESWAPRSAGR